MQITTPEFIPDEVADRFGFVKVYKLTLDSGETLYSPTDKLKNYFYPKQHKGFTKRY